MPDLVENLRWLSQQDPSKGAATLEICGRAAAEIERLRDQLGDELPTTNSLLFDALAEIERLREALGAIAGFGSADLSGEWPAGLRDIIRSMVDCARSALEQREEWK